ncbi:hypothetical protein EVAR_84703_1 [Eumeta japonica]|uniref:Uncharacterized protein n=1 Tax=Eumeta variegata TaxID=151549 RepID=A0A4C1VS42_EUMVA|nr:hypothetical protein EVAR_84703_1 [Eumeta japonica]
MGVRSRLTKNYRDSDIEIAPRGALKYQSGAKKKHDFVKDFGNERRETMDEGEKKDNTIVTLHFFFVTYVTKSGPSPRKLGRDKVLIIVHTWMRGLCGHAPQLASPPAPAQPFEVRYPDECEEAQSRSTPRPPPGPAPRPSLFAPDPRSPSPGGGVARRRSARVPGTVTLAPRSARSLLLRRSSEACSGTRYVRFFFPVRIWNRVRPPFEFRIRFENPNSRLNLESGARSVARVLIADRTLVLWNVGGGRERLSHVCRGHGHSLRGTAIMLPPPAPPGTVSSCDVSDPRFRILCGIEVHDRSLGDLKKN